MQPNKKFLNLDLEFWANIKLLNQRLGYFKKKTKRNPSPAFVVPTVEQVIDVFNTEKLNVSKLVEANKFTDYGLLVIEYLEFRSSILTHHVEPHLMTMAKAKDQFEKKLAQLKKAKRKPGCPLPMNKQTGKKKNHAFLTGLVNLIIDENISTYPCDYDPRELTSITIDGFPFRALSRRVDGAFPSTNNPIAIWEIKEYYYTTSFGSRVADGVYETQLDGWELLEAKSKLGFDVKHYLIIDDYYTWWECGKSYLCRLIDSMHMGLVSEVIFGNEIFERLPELAKEWASHYEKHALK